MQARRGLTSALLRRVAQSLSPKVGGMLLETALMFVGSWLCVGSVLFCVCRPIGDYENHEI